MVSCLFIAWFLFLGVLGSSKSTHKSNLLGWTSPHSDPSEIQIHRHDAQNILGNGFVYEEAQPPPLEMIPLIISGPSSNRVDLVFFSDGCTNVYGILSSNSRSENTEDLPQERQKFIDDALRLAEDVSKNQTFNTVQPLLNFWAGFSPSNETGIGNGGPKQTPFGLYREGTELRGVYYAYPEVGRAACDSLGEQCDYPIFLGNDPLYGGLGGDFTVITASILNGPLVLRHELGHSILDVGEEYDGGFAYFGSNAGHDPKTVPWEQWISDSSRTTSLGDPRIERSVMVMQAYPWTLLNTTTPWSVSFVSSGLYGRYSVQFSLAGIPNKGDLRVTLDGAVLEWEPRTAVGMDRWFYTFFISTSLPSGDHELTFTLLHGENEGSAQLCSTEILEYGSEDEFVSVPGFYSLYPTFSDVNETSFRPTNDDCLMRLVTTPNFCKVCLETLWIKLLRNVTLIDKIDETCDGHRTDPTSSTKVLSLDLLPLAHLRKSPVTPKESYSILWKKDGIALPDFTNKTVIEIEDDKSVGTYTVTVRFSTEEVRLDSPRLESELNYVVRETCQT